MLDPRAHDEILNQILRKARSDADRAWVARRLWFDAAKPDPTLVPHECMELVQEVWRKTGEGDRIKLAKDLWLLSGNVDMRMEE